MKSGKPDRASKPTLRSRLSRAIDRLLYGGRPSDPLYLSNRTWKGWLWLGVKIAAPLAVLGGGLTWYIMAHARAQVPPGYDLPPAEVLTKLGLPELKDVKAQTSREVEVVEVGIERGGPLSLAGIVRNNSTHPIGAAEVDFDITDTSGSRLATETAHFENLAPKAEAKFRLPIPYEKAQIAIVRGIRTK
jgi:hypothetical protein